MFVCNKFPRVMKFSHKPLKLSSFSNQIKLNQFSNPSIFRNFGLFSPFSKLGLFGNQNLQIPSFSNHNITFFKTFSLNSFSTETQAQVSSSTPIQVKSEQITDYGTLIVTDRCSEVRNLKKKILIFKFFHSKIKMIRKLIQQEWVKNKEDAKLRVFVKGGGCSGLEYDFEITAEPLTEDDM